MRWFLALAVIAALALASVGLGATESGLKPGDRIGAMTLARGTAATADWEVWDSCDPVILQPGTYRRRCADIARLRRLWRLSIGYGLFAAPGEIGRLWAKTTWLAWFDGRPLALQRFGTSDRTLYGFPPAGGKNVTLREWRVTLVAVTAGRHTLRYRTRLPGGTIDATWTFTVSQ
jgi:hypothetical protein